MDSTLLQAPEPTGHLIDIEPPAFWGCSSTEIQYAGIFSVLAWLVVFFLIMLCLGWPLLLMLVPAPPLGLFTAYRVCRWIGRTKQGKPHHYYIHRVEMDVFARFRPSPFIIHDGQFVIGRTAQGVR